MKCDLCGRHYFFLWQCPHCGTERYAPKNRLASAMAHPLQIGNFRMNVWYLILLMSVNISIACLAINLVLMRTISGTNIFWAHYVICSLITLCFMLGSGFRAPEKLISYGRRILWLWLLTLGITQLAVVKQSDFRILGYIVPILLLLFDVFCIYCLFSKHGTTFGFTITFLLNIVLSFVLFQFTYWVLLDIPSIILINVAFGISLFLFANYLLVRFLSRRYGIYGGPSA